MTNYESDNCTHNSQSTCKKTEWIWNPTENTELMKPERILRIVRKGFKETFQTVDLQWKPSDNTGVSLTSAFACNLLRYKQIENWPISWYYNTKDFRWDNYSEDNITKICNNHVV